MAVSALQKYVEASQQRTSRLDVQEVRELTQLIKELRLLLNEEIRACARFLKRRLLENWLYQIATHISIDRLRQRARTVERQIDAPVEDLSIADQGRPSPFTIVQQTEMTECVQSYVSSLSDPYKAVLLLHDADRLTADEIARLLHLPLTTVKMRLHRARRTLEAALKKACAFERDERGVLICEPKGERH